jgi:hypothetical protein
MKTFLKLFGAMFLTLSSFAFASNVQWTLGEYFTSFTPNLAGADTSTGIHPPFIVSGTNATSTSASASTMYGVLLTTTTASSDQVIVSGNPSHSLGTAGFMTTDKMPAAKFIVDTGVSVAACTVVAALRATAALDTVTTDTDKCGFIFGSTAGTGNWGIFAGSGTVAATTYDTGIAVTASTRYVLEITVNTLRQPTFYINGTPVTLRASTTPIPFALAAAKNVMPVFGIGTGTTAAKTVYLRYIEARKTE